MLNRLLPCLLAALCLAPAPQAGGPPDRAAPPPSARSSGSLDLFSSAIRQVQDRYLFPENVVPEKMLEAAARRLEDEVEWLMVDAAVNRVTLRHGDGHVLGTVEVGGMDDLPRALEELRRILVQGDTLDPDLVPEVEILRGAISTLDSPSVLLAGEKLESFDERLKGTLSGIGSRIGMENGDILVKKVFPDSPAQNAGIQDGDIILRIDGISTVGMATDDATDRIRGPAGTRLRLSLRRGNRELDVTLVRAEIRIPNLEHQVLPSGVSWLRISHFSEQTVENLDEELNRLEEEGGLDKGLILDLRGNTGGSMIQAAESADRFLVEGSIVRTVGRDGEPVSGLVRQIRAEDDQDEPPVPIVLLVDEDTASGSEILAGALQLLDRAILLGQRTYGKGTVQKVYTLRSDVRLKLTVAQYLLEGDLSVSGNGLVPDVSTGWVVLDRNGARFLAPVASGPIPPLTLVDERAGWRPTANPPPSRSDPERDAAERILLASHGPHREDLLDSARTLVPTLVGEEEARLVESFQQGGLDWSPSPALPAEGKGAPQVRLHLEAQGSTRAGEVTTLKVRVDNTGAEPLHRVRVHLWSENDLWDRVTLPVGKVPARGSGTGWATLQVPPNQQDRLDQVTLTLEADQRPQPPPQRMTLALQGRPAPALAVKGVLVPRPDPSAAGADSRQVQLTLENQGKEDLLNVRVRFDFPADEAIELKNREGFLPSLAAGESRRVDLDLVVKPGFQGSSLPLTLMVDAERWGALTRWDWPQPLDGTLRAGQAPTVRFVKAPSQSPSGQEVKVTFRATDDGPLDHLVWYVNGKKTGYREGGARKEDVELRFKAMAGSNKVIAVAEDGTGLRTRAVAWVLGTTEGPLSFSEDDQAPDPPAP